MDRLLISICQTQRIYQQILRRQCCLLLDSGGHNSRIQMSQCLYLSPKTVHISYMHPPSRSCKLPLDFLYQSAWLLRDFKFLSPKRSKRKNNLDQNTMILICVYHICLRHFVNCKIGKIMNRCQSNWSSITFDLYCASKTTQ